MASTFDYIVVYKLRNLSWSLDETVLSRETLNASGVTLVSTIPATAGPPARRGQLEKPSQPQVGNPLSRFRNALGGIADTGRERTTLDVRYEISKNGTSGSIADPEAGPRKISHMEE